VERAAAELLIFRRGAFGGLDEDALVPRGRVIGISDGEGWMWRAFVPVLRAGRGGWWIGGWARGACSG
jgi:hypothetical protein